MKPTNFSGFYTSITDMADRINRKRMQKIEVTKEEEALMVELIKDSRDLFQRIMYGIQEDVVNSVFELGILQVAAFYGKRALNRNFFSITNTAKILRAIVSKLAAAEKKELECHMIGSDELVKITPANCRMMLKMAESNFEITLTDRRNLKDLLVAMRWDKEPVQKVAVKAEEKVEVKAETVMAIALETAATNGKAKAVKK